MGRVDFLAERALAGFEAFAAPKMKVRNPVTKKKLTLKKTNDAPERKSIVAEFKSMVKEMRELVEAAGKNLQMKVRLGKKKRDDRYKTVVSELTEQTQQIAINLYNVVTKLRNSLTTQANSLVNVRRLTAQTLPQNIRNLAAAKSSRLDKNLSRIQELYDTLSSMTGGKEIKLSILGPALVTLSDAFEAAEDARMDADMFFRGNESHLQQAQAPAKPEAESVAPAFAVHSKFLVIGDPRNPAEEQAYTKIRNTMNLGAGDFPDPYTSMYKFYGNSGLPLDPKVRMCLLMLIRLSAKSNKQPTQHNVLALWNMGDPTTAEFEHSKGKGGYPKDFEPEARGKRARENANKIVASLVRKINTPEFRDKLLAKYSKDIVTSAEEHLLGSSSVLNKAKVHYTNEVNGWFGKYLPKL